jgi:hypothetical protein
MLAIVVYKTFPATKILYYFGLMSDYTPRIAENASLLPHSVPIMF